MGMRADVDALSGREDGGAEMVEEDEGSDVAALGEGQRRTRCPSLFLRGVPGDRGRRSVSYTHLTLPTSDLV